MPEGSIFDNPKDAKMAEVAGREGQRDAEKDALRRDAEKREREYSIEKDAASRAKMAEVAGREGQRDAKKDALRRDAGYPNLTGNILNIDPRPIDKPLPPELPTISDLIKEPHLKPKFEPGKEPHIDPRPADKSYQPSPQKVKPGLQHPKRDN